MLQWIRLVNDMRLIHFDKLPVQQCAAFFDACPPAVPLQHFSEQAFKGRQNRKAIT